jgi:hypothetical protein
MSAQGTLASPAKIDALPLCQLGQLLLLVDGHRDIGPQHVVILAQQVLVVTVSQQVAGAVIKQPSDLNEQQPVGQVDPMQSLVLDIVKPEPLVDRIRLFEAGGHCLTRVQGADESVRNDGAGNSPELGCSFGIKGTQRLLVGAKVCFELLATDHHTGMLCERWHRVCGWQLR